MTSRVLKAAFLLCLVLSFVGCELYYVPPHIQTPSHTKKGDVSINAQGLYTGSASASYAFSDNIFLGGSFMGYSASNNDSFSNDYFRVTTFEAGFFDYDTLTNFCFQLTGGIGSGSVGDPSTGFDARFNRFYLQPSFSFFSERKNLENHLTVRISNINYMRQNFQNIDPFSVRFIEPAYTFRAGSEFIKFHAQIGLSIPFSDINNRPVEFFHDPFIFGIGVQANFNVLGKGRFN